MDKAVSRRGRSLQGISQPGKFAEVWNTTVVKQEGANVTRVRRRKKGGQWVWSLHCGGHWRPHTSGNVSLSV